MKCKVCGLDFSDKIYNIHVEKCIKASETRVENAKEEKKGKKGKDKKVT